MSLSAAVAELNKEIATLGKNITEAQRTQIRLIAHRDALLKEGKAGSGNTTVQKGKPGRKPGRPAKKAVPAKKAASLKKVADTKKAASAKKPAAAKKRTISSEGRKRMAEAQQRRWAAKKQTSKSE